MEDVISHIVEEWFLTEPLLFSAYCTHQLAENTKMTVPMRIGKMRIEYNPDILQDWRTDAIEERLKYEVIRILLGHPYQRQPYKAKKSTLGIASDVTLADAYHKISSITLPPGLKYDRGLCFEEYYAIVEAFLKQQKPQEQGDVIEGLIGGLESDEDEGESDSPLAAGGTGPGLNGDQKESAQPEEKGRSADEGEEENSPEEEKDDDGGGNDDDESEAGDRDEKEKSNGGEGEKDPLQQLMDEAAESAELWEEDQLAAEQVKETVRRAQRSRQWGSVAGNLKDEIEATTIVKIDYRTILSGFRASILCSKRRLTRMIPSRRYGFQYMGSKRDFATRLLVAIDVSGSVVDEQVAQALSIINRFFKYGVENVDVIQFDYDLQGDVLPMKKAQKTLKIQGRGGTNFQPPIDYFLENRYDGLIMITDGYSTKPELPKNFYGNILWMLYDDDTYRKGQIIPAQHQWITELPKNKFTILPPV